MTLDLPTIYVVMICTSLALAVALGAVAAGREVPGLWQLAVAMLVSTVMFTLYTLYGRLPQLLTIALPNALGSVSVSLTLLAIAELRRIRIHLLHVVLPPLLVFVASVLLSEQTAARLLVVNLLIAAQRAILLWVLMRDGGIGLGRGRYILEVSFVVFLLELLGRALAVVFGAELPTVLSSAASATVSNLVSFLAVVLTGVGFVLATAEIAADRSHRLALLDPLTGLPNRRAALDALQRQWSAASRSGQPLTALILDLDHFKPINDQHGHLGGDAVLQQLAELFKSRLRGQDLIGRIGGEEFLIVLPNTAAEDGRAVAEALRQEIAQLAIDVGGKELHITASIGVYGNRPAGDDSVADVMRRADQALYRAKAGGRNQVAMG